MGCPGRHREHHLGQRLGWLRAAVLGANDGIVSTASLIVGVAAASAAHSDVLVAGSGDWLLAQRLWPLANTSP